MQAHLRTHRRQSRPQDPTATQYAVLHRVELGVRDLVVALFVTLEKGPSGSCKPLQAFNITLKNVAVSRFYNLETTFTSFYSMMRTLTSGKSKLSAMTGKKFL